MTRAIVRLLTACVLLGASLEAQAQLISVHKVDLTLKTVRQGMNGLDGKPLKKTWKSDDVFNACFGDLGPDYGVYAFFECDSLNDNSLVGYYTVNGGSKAIGSMEFDNGFDVITTTAAGTITKAATAPFTIEVDCGGAISFTLTGIADITLKEVEGETCADTVKAKITGIGTATDLDGNFIVDQGSSISIKKPILVEAP